MSRRIPSGGKKRLSANKPKESKPDENINEEKHSPEQQKDMPPHELSSDYILLQNDDCLVRRLEDEKELIVPHNSPRSDFLFDKCVDTIPEKIKNVEKLNIPYVRVTGIRRSIEILGDFFDCSLYKTSLLQFWFLDMVTDCLWKCQDEFLLNDRYQKTVLTWVLYFFDLIRDPRKNLSRADFFRLFSETMELAEEHIQCGDSVLPKPDELFLVDPPLDEYDEFLSDSTDSSLSFGECSSERSFLVLPSEENPDLPKFFKLPARECGCDISVTSSVETLSEKSIYIEDKTQNKEDPDDTQEDENVKETYSISEFYQPDETIHSRFLDTPDEEEEEEPDEDEINPDLALSDLEYEWVTEAVKKPAQKVTDKPTKSAATLRSSHSGSERSSGVRRLKSIIRSKSRMISSLAKKRSPSSPVERKELDGKTLVKAWFEYNLWEERKSMMADPQRGWTPLEPELCAEDCICEHIEYSPEDFHSEDYCEIKREWLEYLDKHKETIKENTLNVFVNSVLLLIVKEFVLEYFYESFQFKLIKMAYRTVPNLIYEKINDKWQIPKESRGEFKRPVEKKPKPPKPVKEKKVNKVKKEEKKKDKKSNKSKESGKKDKTSKTKKEKIVKPTKEEKEERERLRREEEIRKEQEIIAEQNKRFIFPLAMAANEEFFKSIFKDYTPPLLAKQKKGDEKDKKKKKKR